MKSLDYLHSFIEMQHLILLILLGFGRITSKVEKFDKL